MKNNDTIEVVVEGGSKEVLTQQHYKASGGEGTVYQKGGTAYKIMHPGHSVIPHKKLEELNRIQADNVLIPLKYLLDAKGKPVGFTMRYVHDVEFLCKLFNNNFLQRNNLGPNDIIQLVKEMQLTLSKIHAANCLVVDFNQMNFLVDGKKFKIPYFIDTDSYQTPSYKATAIMDCIRDRKSPSGQFSQLTDWYSWGVVTFWLYIGTHPYRGSHPKYGNNDWNGKRMDDGISIFDANVTMPACCRDLSVIPKPHLDWYKNEFHKNDRSIPPMPDGHIVVTVGIQVKDVVEFKTYTVFEYNLPIRRIFFDRGNRFVLTQDTLYKDDAAIMKYSERYENVGFIRVEDGEDDPVLAGLQDGNIIIYDWKKNVVLHELAADEMMCCNGTIYTRCGDVLVQHTCTKLFDRTIHSVKQVANVFSPTCKLFDGVAIQDVVGKCMMAMQDEENDFVNVPVPDLDKKRIIDAKCIGSVCVVITEKKGKFERHVLTFSKGRTNYHIRTSEADSSDSAEFMIKESGLCVAPVGSDLETWSGPNSKLFKDGPIPAGAIMYAERGKTMFAVGSKLYQIEKK